MNIIDGKKIALQIKDELKNKVQEFKARFDRDIVLAVILVGNNPASEIYVKNKIKSAEFVGIKSLSYTLPETATENEVVKLVTSLSEDNSVDGILVQLPLPKAINEDKILDLIPAEKDVDGFTPTNIGNLALGKPSVVACTPFGVLKMIKSTGVDLTGKNAVVIGRSNIVGKPMAMLLLQENCTVTVCHSKTRNLKEICLNAEIIVSAVGKINTVTEDMVKPNAIIIDVGINRTESGIKGDVDFDNVKEKVSYISPVPGGVGPMTIAMLLENTYNVAIKREEK